MRRVFALIALVALALLGASGVANAADIYQDGGSTNALGGVMATSNGQLEISVPANAYPVVDVPIRIRYYPDMMNNFQAPPANTIWVGQPFRLQLTEWYSGSYVSYNQPMTMTVHYNPSDLGGRSESTVRVIRLSGAVGPFSHWDVVPGTLDTTRHVVTVQVPYGGDYGLVADNVSTSSAPTASVSTAVPVASTSSVISGTVFYDKNGNGVMDGDDFPIEKAGVLITSGPWSAFTTTGPDGKYSFSGLAGGTYSVQLVVGTEWAFTTPNAVSGIGVTGQGGSTGSADFGMWYKLWFRGP